MTIITMMSTRACGLDCLVDYFNVQTCDVWEGNMSRKKGGDPDRAHLFLRVLGYKRGSDVTEGHKSIA